MHAQRPPAAAAGHSPRSHQARPVTARGPRQPGSASAAQGKLRAASTPAGAPDRSPSRARTSLRAASSLPSTASYECTGTDADLWAQPHPVRSFPVALDGSGSDAELLPLTARAASCPASTPEQPEAGLAASHARPLPRFTNPYHNDSDLPSTPKTPDPNPTPYAPVALDGMPNTNINNRKGTRHAGLRRRRVLRAASSGAAAHPPPAPEEPATASTTKLTVEASDMASPRHTQDSMPGSGGQAGTMQQHRGVHAHARPHLPTPTVSGALLPPPAADAGAAALPASMPRTGGAATHALLGRSRALLLMVLLVPLALPFINLQAGFKNLHLPGFSVASGPTGLTGLAGLQGASPSPGKPHQPAQYPWKGMADAATAAARRVRAAATTRPDLPLSAPAPSRTPSPAPGGWDASAAVRVVTIVPRRLSSPYRTTWGELAAHTAQRLAWSDPSFQMRVFYEEDLAQDDAAGEDGAAQGGQGGAGAEAEGEGGARRQLLQALREGCQVMLGVALQQPAVASWLASPAAASSLPPATLFLESAPNLSALGRLPGGWTPPLPTPPTPSTPSTQSVNPLAQVGRFLSQALAAVTSVLPGGQGGAAGQLYRTIQELYGRRNSDDFLFIYLVLINQYVRPVPEVSMTTKGFDFDSLRCMVTQCGRQVLDCVSDAICKAGLDCLQACSFNDQVCQYRCIVSHETPKFFQFSLCILQLHNCRNLDAKMPTRPDPRPMPSFRGQPLTHEAAEDMFIGWMAPQASSGVQTGGSSPAGSGGDKNSKPLPWSWLVAAGKNPAYDYFPCQHQLFYRGKGKGVMWYEPVFRVITLSGEQVWRRRRYRVRRGQLPGTFHFSVLDNGVTSNEFWRILDCDEALEWCLFYYSGAATTAGLSYSGAVLGSRDGAMPAAPETLQRLERALDAGGIKMWELSLVDNTHCQGAPLELGTAPA